MRSSLSKSERLHKKSDIENIFKEGKSFVQYPFKAVYRITESEEHPIKFGISIPKKKHKKAVDRNLLKRRSREAYRKNNSKLKSIAIKKDITIHLFLIFLSTEKQQYHTIENKIILLLQRLEQNNE